ncbi:hypothetical protein KIN20_010603 [Parelaphostrongylus tenuis]|uniref:Uncharacterized protein n=1 Tax=Parelaphostrongylus tenuis TaxID=148309 RepID=A0AAD5MS47_PARTN|nr:hypothetical protein KIN20_010603 [Parelaphostrongylus tenuis]
MSTPDSSSIRQQILSLRTLLQRNQASHTHILKGYTVRSEQTDFTHLDGIQIEAFYAEILSDASDKESDRNVPVAREDPQPAASSTPTANYVIPHDNSLLNFVDASILSKVELPSFDGNLPDYPEFRHVLQRWLIIKGN